MYLHRLLLGEPHGKEIDHRDGDGLNNTRNNLRVTSHADNMQNLQGALKHSKTGIRGVSKRHDRNLWKVDVCVGGTRYRKYSKTKEEAEAKAVELRAELMPYSNDREVIRVG
ncbi:HNH endonuclease [Paenibacillus sp. CAU 1782]